MNKLHHPFIHQLHFLNENVNELKQLLISKTYIKPFYSDDDLSKLMSVSKETLKNWRKNDLIEYSKIGNKIIYKHECVINMLDSHKVSKKKADMF